MKKVNVAKSFALASLIASGVFFGSSCKKDKKAEEVPACLAPAIASVAQTTVISPSYMLSLSISNIDSPSLISLTNNGLPVPFTYNTSTDVLTANLNLSQGSNLISLTANGCSVATNTFVVYYATNTINLTGKNFRLTASTVEPSLGGTSDLYAQMQDCDKDNLERFDTPNVYKYDEGPTKCGVAYPQTIMGTWAWNSDETALMITLYNQTNTYTILQNDGTTLKLKYSEYINGTNHVFTYTYVKQ